MTVTAQPSDVFNQPPPLEGHNAFESNLPLVESVDREGAGWAVDQLRTLGVEAGDRHTLELGRLANENPPVLKTHDRFGNRIDEVEFHPAWHELMRHAVGHGMAALPWRRPGPGAHVARAAIMLTMSGVEAGTGCPISMTYAAVPALRKQPDLAAEWEPRLTSLEYDGEVLKPAVREARGAVRHGHDRAPGRIRRAREHHARRADRDERRVRADGPQVVLLGADVRRLPGARADRRRRHLLPAAALHARRRSQHVPHQPPEGQARQPVERVERGRVRQAPGRTSSARRAAVSRRSSRWSTTRGSTACSGRPA